MHAAIPDNGRTLDGATPAVAILAHLDGPAGAFRVPRHGRRIVWEHHGFHAAACAADPELYALAALREGTDAHRVQVLFQLLRADRSALDAGVVETLEQVTARLLTALPADDVLTAFLALRRVRVNRPHATRAIVHFVLGHPALPALVAARRPAVRDVLTHALGQPVAAATLAALAQGERAVRLGRLGVDGAGLETVAAYLLRQGPVPVTELALDESHTPLPQPLVVAPDTVTVTNRGAVAAALVHAWRSEVPDDAHALEVAQSLDALTDGLGRFDGRVAVVVDASASMAGYGDREHALASQTAALWLVLGRVVRDLHTVWVGGVVPLDADPVSAAVGLRAAGATDLATGLLDAAATAPDVILVITDGYESRRAGDLARVAAALPGAGVDAPVLVALSLFSAADAIDHRRPAPHLTELTFWHESELARLVTRVLAHAPRGRGADFLRTALAGALQGGVR